MSRKIFSATVSDNGLVHICGSGKVSNLALSLTLIARSIYEVDSLDDEDREFINDYVQNHLGRIAFMEPDELDEELVKLAEEVADQGKELEEAKEKLFRHMHDVCDGNNALTKEIGNTLKKLLKEMGEL